MALVRFGDYYTDGNQSFSDTDFDINRIKGMDVYAQDEDKIGSIDDVLVDERDGRFRYYIVDTGFWIFGKRVLLPVGLAKMDSDRNRFWVNNLTKQQVENLPNFDDLERLDFAHEEEVRNVYRPMANTSAQRPAKTYDRDRYDYDQDEALYNLNDRDNQSLKLYEERLIANKTRQKVGEVKVGKQIETEQARVSVPVEKERVVIDRKEGDHSAIATGTPDFNEGEVARMEVYEETPDIRKETFVREEVQVRKEVDRTSVDADEEVRREELDIDTQGGATVDKRR